MFSWHLPNSATLSGFPRRQLHAI